MSSIPKIGLPTHLDLPDKDESVVENYFELPQAVLLTESIKPVLKKVHPDGKYAIGGNSFIYFRYTKEDPLQGCRAPDWFYIPGVHPIILDGHIRRSYVLWQELVPPTIVLEVASDNGDEERDTTPDKGKFWIYEREIRPLYYGIFIEATGELEMYQLRNRLFQQMTPNQRGHYTVPEMRVELGLWQDRSVTETDVLYMRWYDLRGRLLLTGDERAEQEKHNAEQANKRAEEEKQRADHLAAKLRELGIDPDQV